MRDLEVLVPPGYRPLYRQVPQSVYTEIVPIKLIFRIGMVQIEETCSIEKQKTAEFYWKNGRGG